MPLVLYQSLLRRTLVFSLALSLVAVVLFFAFPFVALCALLISLHDKLQYSKRQRRVLLSIRCCPVRAAGR